MVQIQKPDRVTDSGNSEWYWKFDVPTKDYENAIRQLNNGSVIRIGFGYDVGLSKSHRRGQVGIYEVVNRAETEHFRKWMNRKPTKKEKEAAIREIEKIFRFGPLAGDPNLDY